MPGGQVKRSMVSNGCIIGGVVEQAILSPGVVVEAGAVVKNAVIMTDSYIGRGAVVEHAIIDKQVRVGAGARVGGEGMGQGEAARDARTLAIVGKGGQVAPNARVAPGDIVALGARVDR